MARRLLRGVRIALLIVLAAMLVGALIARNWGVAVPAAVFVALILFVEAVERGYVGGGGRGRDRPSR